MAFTAHDGKTRTTLSEINMVPFIDIVLVLLIMPSRCEARTATTLTALARHAIGNCNYDETETGAAITDNTGSPKPALAP